MKKLVSLLLVLSLCLSLGVTALAADGGFSDVKPEDELYDAVQWALEKGITEGVGNGEFGADGTVTRAQVVTFFWRMIGAPEPMIEADFADVAADAWYADAVRWAVHHGLVQGYSETQFGPDDPCTREQAATFLYREEQRRGGGFTGMWAFPLRFSDAEKVSDWAYAPLCWLTMEGVLPADGEYGPQEPCSRGALVTMLYRYCEGLEANEAPAYTEKEFRVLRDSLDSTETVTLRCYDDLPDVPYMSVTDFYNRFYLAGTDLTEGMRFTCTGSHYVLTNFYGSRAEFDTRTEAICCDMPSDFRYMAKTLLEATTDDVEDAIFPFLQSFVGEDADVPVPLRLSLGDYGIDLRGDDSGVYAPVPTLSDFFATGENYYIVYAGETLYVRDLLGFFQERNALDEDPDYIAGMKADRPEDLAEFTYRELCFNVDSFYGKPGQEWIHEALETQTLDEILTEAYPDVKALLLAPGFEDFCTGTLYLFNGLLFDGGHTSISGNVLREDPELILTMAESLFQKDYGAPYNDLGAIRTAHLAQCMAWRASVLGDGWYYEQGDTALICLDAFDYDHAGWLAFYAGEGERPLEGDTFGTLLAGLERAAANPEIRNVIIDESCNGGGYIAVMLGLEYLTTGRSLMRYRDGLTGQIITAGDLADLNFDGVFDELDESPFAGFRYGVLTSSNSFSCGNNFPFAMREFGAMILGERSGGGACSVRCCSVGGVECSTSDAVMCVVDAAGESVDTGCPVDADLLTDGENPYENFYDLALLSAKMNEFFDGKAD